MAHFVISGAESWVLVTKTTFVCRFYGEWYRSITGFIPTQETAD